MLTCWSEPANPEAHTLQSLTTETFSMKSVSTVDFTQFHSENEMLNPESFIIAQALCQVFTLCSFFYVPFFPFFTTPGV